MWSILVSCIRISQWSFHLAAYGRILGQGVWYTNIGLPREASWTLDQRSFVCFGLYVQVQSSIYLSKNTSPGPVIPKCLTVPGKVNGHILSLGHIYLKGQNSDLPFNHFNKLIGTLSMEPVPHPFDGKGKKEWTSGLQHYLLVQCKKLIWTHRISWVQNCNSNKLAVLSRYTVMNLFIIVSAQVGSRIGKGINSTGFHPSSLKSLSFNQIYTTYYQRYMGFKLMFAISLP